MRALSVSRRRLLLAPPGGLAALAVAACAPDDRLPGQVPGSSLAPRADVHLSLTQPRSHATIVFARAHIDAAQPDRLANLAATVNRHRASLALSRTLLPDLATILPAMPEFPGDVLRADRTHPDVVLLIEGDTPEETSERAATLTQALESTLTITWQSALHHHIAGTSKGRALTTNVFGFTEGFGNPAPDKAPHATLLTTQPGAPTWARGGALLAIRVIQVSQELWQRDTPDEHERIIGRRKDGTWLDGTPGTAPAPFHHDRNGHITPLDSHVRAANPTDHQHPRIEITRRGWTYTHPNPDETGTLFMAYTNNLQRFDTLQRRVIGDALTPYTLTTGGGYLYAPPPHLGWLRRRGALHARSS